MKPLIGLLLIASSLAVAADKAEKPPEETPAECKKRLGNEVKCFVLQARYYRLMCSMTMQLADLGGGEPDGVVNCISNAETNMRGFYDSARKRLVKAKPASEALKEAYAYWGSTIQGIASGPDEARISYRRRQQEREQGLEDRLRRLELEM